MDKQAAQSLHYSDGSDSDQDGRVSRSDTNCIHILIRGDKPGANPPVWKFERRRIQAALLNIQDGVNSGKFVLDRVVCNGTPDGALWEFHFVPKGEKNS